MPRHTQYMQRRFLHNKTEINEKHMVKPITIYKKENKERKKTDKIHQQRKPQEA